MDVLYSCLRRLSAVALVSSGCLSFAHAQQNPEIGFSDGLLSVNASNVPVMQLADALSRELGIKVSVQGDTDAAISADINDEPVEKAIARLSPNHMLVHASKALNADILEVVLIVAEGGTQTASGGEFLPSGAPADEIVAGQPPAVPAAALPEDTAGLPEDGSNGQLRDKMRKLNARIVGANNPNTGVEGQTAVDPATGTTVDTTAGSANGTATADTAQPTDTTQQQ